MIKLELDLSPQQLIAVGIALGGKPMVLDTPLTRDELTDADFEAKADNVRTEQIAEENHKVAVAEAAAERPDNGPLAEPASPAATAFAADPDLKEFPKEDVTSTDFAADVELAEATTTVELAKGTNGQMIPWDARIHGKAKKQNADGSWRLVQGVDRDTLVPQVEGELVEAQQAAPKPAEGATVPSPEQAPTTQQSSAVVTPTAPAAAPSVPNPPNATAKPTTFPELLPLVTAAKAAGTLTDETIANACAELGLATFGLIATRPDLIPQAAELLGV